MLLSLVLKSVFGLLGIVIRNIYGITPEKTYENELSGFLKETGYSVN